MVYPAKEVRAGTFAISLLTTSYSTHLQQQTFHPAWNLQALHNQMENAQMVSPSIPGRKVALLSGMLLVWKHFCYFLCGYGRQKCWLSSCYGRGQKEEDIRALAVINCFTPIAIETSGVFGPDPKCFLTSLSSQIRALTHDDMVYCYLCPTIAHCCSKGQYIVHLQYTGPL